MLERKRVYSFYSHIVIYQEVFEKALLSLKERLSFSKDIKSADTFINALKLCGWKSHLDTFGNITALHYNNDNWNHRAQICLYAITKFVLSGSSVKMADENYNIFWMYCFSGGQITKKSLHRFFIDFENKAELILLFERIIKSLLRLNYSAKALRKIVSESFAEHMCE
jgi:hypothetical protein